MGFFTSLSSVCVSLPLLFCFPLELRFSSTLSPSFFSRETNRLMYFLGAGCEIRCVPRFTCSGVKTFFFLPSFLHLLSAAGSMMVSMFPFLKVTGLSAYSEGPRHNRRRRASLFSIFPFFSHLGFSDDLAVLSLTPPCLSLKV